MWAGTFPDRRQKYNDRSRARKSLAGCRTGCGRIHVYSPALKGGGGGGGALAGHGPRRWETGRSGGGGGTPAARWQ